MVRLCAILWPFTFGTRLGWLTAGVPNPPAERVRDRIFFFRGQGAVGSNGLGQMCGLLRRAGYWAEDLRCVGHRWVVRYLQAEQKESGTRGRIVFVGHSAGGRYALVAARQLSELGIGVDLLICLDVAMPDPVPANVRSAVHLYFGGWRLYPARPLCAAPGSTARIENVALNAPSSPIDARWLGHLNITDSLAIQEYVLRRILDTVS